MTTMWSSLTARAIHSHSVYDRALTPIGGGDAVTTDTRIDPATIEARCRRLMAQHAATERRGWDSERARDDLRAEIDAWLDEWLAANTCEAQSEGPQRRDGRPDTMRCQLPRGHDGSHASGDGRWWIEAKP